MATGAERVGWKIGRGLVEGEEHLEPVIGHLTSATTLPAGGTFRAGSAKALRADAELALEIGGHGTPVLYGAALELVDVARPPDDFESILAANIWHRAVAFGPLRHEPAPELLQAQVRINGEKAGAAEASVDAHETARIASELLAVAGEQLEPGDRIIAGSLVHVAVEPGDEVVVDLGALGEVGLSLR